MATKLSETATRLLTQAADNRINGYMVPADYDLPAPLRAVRARVAKTLVTLELLEADGGAHRITAAGFAAIGMEQPTDEPTGPIEIEAAIDPATGNAEMVEPEQVTALVEFTPPDVAAIDAMHRDEHPVDVSPAPLPSVCRPVPPPTLRSAAQSALEAFDADTAPGGWMSRMEAAMNALRAALAPSKPQASAEPRAATKKAQVIAMLRAGATLQQIMDATGWQKHTAGAFISIQQKDGATVEKARNDNKELVYTLVG